MSGACVYVQRSEDGTVLYVGMSMFFGERLKSHASVSPWFKKVTQVDIVHCESRAHALDMEAHLITAMKPIHTKPSKRHKKFHFLGLRQGVIDNFMKGAEL